MNINMMNFEPRDFCNFGKVMHSNADETHCYFNMLIKENRMLAHGLESSTHAL